MRPYLPTQPPKRTLLVRFLDGVYVTTLLCDLVDGRCYVGYIRTLAETRAFSPSNIINVIA